MHYTRLIQIPRIATFDAAAELPSRLIGFKWGRNETVNGPVFVGEKTLRVFDANQRRAGIDTAALDFEHNTVPGSPEYLRSQEPRKIAGTGRPFVARDAGVGLDALTFTPEGRDAITGRHYTDVSAAVALDENREVIFLHSLAACRQGAAPDIHLFSAGIGADGKLATINPEANDRRPETGGRKDKGTRPMNKLILALFTALGLTPPKDDATDEQIAESAKGLLAALKPAAPDLSTFTTQLAEFKTKLDGLLANAGKDAGAALQTFTARLEALETFNVTAQRDAILMQAAYEGKVVPKEVLPGADGKGGLDLPALKTFVAALPVTVPLSQRTPSAIKTFTASAGAGAPSAETQAVREQLGITKEDVEKFGKKS